ncbi:hypothetical protein SOVF_109580 [Spinacia oleracea]|uniref:F-box/kelch-repeat protein At3g06240-like n=1 Tax=Spinacia oleracea TaxID=3562 RepID=A0A9R0J4Q9_SPIOL|nr:F-box/kelch-repeat protein At3g06240-like [Spinacia oleracea]KNA14217.1 hypothetical protein SOVF_109580 [Spinacia oleracea]
MSARKMEQKEQSKMLPEEMIVEVFLRLPAKSVGRFRCVSNRWNYLLTQPQFVKTHLNLTKQHPSIEEPIILYTPDSGALYSTHLNNAHHLFDEMTCFATKLNFDDRRFYLTHYLDGSCDGLVLMRNDDLNKLLLINPTTREIKELPSLGYARDPKTSSTTYGLGYDSVSDDYKVVMISMCVDVYSVRNGTWKRVENSPYDHMIGDCEPGVFIDGNIHWIASKASDDSFVIATFDLGKEKFRELPFPSLVDSEIKCTCNYFDDDEEEIEHLAFSRLVTLEGCLCGFPDIFDRCQSPVAWMMKKYGFQESWTKMFLIRVSDSMYRPICLFGKKQVVLVMREETTNEKLTIYNSEDETVKDIVVDGIPGKFVVGGSFIETLVSPHCNNGVV